MYGKKRWLTQMVIPNFSVDAALGPYRPKTDKELEKALADPDAVIKSWEQGHAWAIGYDLIPLAAWHALRASRDYGIWKFIFQDVHACDTPRDINDRDKCQTCWWKYILPASELVLSKPSPSLSKTDPWCGVRKRIDAFRLWAGLIEDHINAAQPITDASDPTPPTPVSPENGGPPKKKRTVEEVIAEVEKNVKDNGGKWPGYAALEEQGYARGTLQKAAAQSVYLKARLAESKPPPGKNPRAVTLTEAVEDIEAKKRDKALKQLMDGRGKR